MFTKVNIDGRRSAVASGQPAHAPQHRATIRHALTARLGTCNGHHSIVTVGDPLRDAYGPSTGRGGQQKVIRIIVKSRACGVVRHKIGRASCRERVEKWWGGGGRERRERNV